MATCDVTFTLQDVGGTAYDGAVIRARYALPQSATDDTIVGVDRWVSATTDANGEATLALVQGATVRIVCVEAGIDLEMDVPEQATYVFARHLATRGM